MPSHYYTILSAHAFDAFDAGQLVKLRNPHGTGGQEWAGDWGDASPLPLYVGGRLHQVPEDVHGDVRQVAAVAVVPVAVVCA